MEVKKLSKQKEAEIRAKLYNQIADGFEGFYQHEPVTKGRLITIPMDGVNYYATVNVTLHNPEKFDVEEVRHEYLTKLEANAQREAERAEKARIKAEKAANKQNNN
ncbi:MAG: hypothetical protein IJE43_14860 [Alphaproteobacteria bacterium]|nr:hypothetical protein [Alphaproteobacteria bacterium]